MPSNLYLNEDVTFIAGRNFTFAGEKFEVGDEFDQELAPGRIEQLVRTRHVYPVVDDRADKTRFFHREVHVREDIDRILGKDRGVGQIQLVRAEEPEPLDTGEPADPGAALQLQALQNSLTTEVLEQENADPEEKQEGETEPGETEPLPLVHPEEVEEDNEENYEEPEVAEEDLYDPSEHLLPEVQEYLDGEISQEEYNRVIAAEKLGKNRKGIVGDD